MGVCWQKVNAMYMPKTLTCLFHLTQIAHLKLILTTDEMSRCKVEIENIQTVFTIINSSLGDQWSRHYTICIHCV